MAIKEITARQLLETLDEEGLVSYARGAGKVLIVTEQDQVSSQTVSLDDRTFELLQDPHWNFVDCQEQVCTITDRGRSRLGYLQTDEVRVICHNIPLSATRVLLANCDAKESAVRAFLRAVAALSER